MRYFKAGVTALLMVVVSWTLLDFIAFGSAPRSTIRDYLHVAIGIGIGLYTYYTMTMNTEDK